MPMIDILAAEGTFPEAAEAALLDRVTACLLQWEKTTNIPLAVKNTGAFLHVLPKARVTAGGQPDRVVRVQILTPEHALTQEQRAGITAGITAIVDEVAGEPKIGDRTWVLFHEAIDGGWGIGGTAYTNAALADSVRASLKR
ncbi:MAG TPA: tautomerase family protein [Polyangiales bacterium]|nr:tautomerase family protein [Polyangiales bacterium]